MERAVHTSDGRALAVEDAGDPAGRVVLVHGGTPNSRHLYGPWVADAAERGLRLIGYDRPGYGRSTPCPGYSIADCAADVRAICAALEIDRLATWGISGGGPYPLACAALLPDLVAAAASLASPAPYEAEALDWFAGMEEDDVDGNWMLLSDPEAARAKMDKDRDEALATTASELAQALESFLSPADAAVMDDQMAEYLTYCDHEGLAPGSQGWWDDARAHVRPWGFELSDISRSRAAAARQAGQVRSLLAWPMARCPYPRGRSLVDRHRRAPDARGTPRRRSARLAVRTPIETRQQLQPAADTHLCMTYSLRAGRPDDRRG